MKRLPVVLASILFVAVSSWIVMKLSRNESRHPENNVEKLDGEDYFFSSHGFPYYKIDYDAHRNAAVSFRNSLAFRSANTASWQFAGPVNSGGRIVDVEFDPANQQIAYLGAASGGVFKTIDGGATWFPVFDNETTLSIGDIAIAPSDPNILYVGTGEANGGSGSLTYDANGIYKSTDAGTTWTNIGLQSTRMTGRLAIHPANPDIVFAACMGDMYGATPDRGLYKTTNGGATWTNVLFVNDSTGAVDVVINPQNPNIVFASTWKRTRYHNSKDYAGYESGVWKSTNGGNTFTRLDASNGLPPLTQEYSRIGIDLCAASPNVVYCLYIDDQYDFQGLYKSVDNGISWVQTNDAQLINSMGNGQGYWFGRVKCDPTNSDILYVIGFDIYKTTDGGNSYSHSFNNAHVDQHAVAIHPLNHDFVMVGNDGGLYLSYDGGNVWTQNQALPISQIYRAEIDFSNPSNLYVGLQDNGTNRTLTGAMDDYEWIFGGDGFQSLVDRGNSLHILVGYQYGNIFKSTNGGFNWMASSQNGIVGTANWNYPLTADPQNSNVVYSGAQRVFRSTNFGDSWIDVSPDLTTLDLTGTLIFGTITYINVSRLNSNIIYAGTDDGKVWNTLNGGSTWTQVNSGLPVRWVTGVETDPFNSNIAYVTLSGYRFHDPISHVYKTINNGQSWINIGSSLPDIPCNSIKADPDVPGVLYLATDVGVYFSSDTGVTWEPAGSGMPIVVCTDLKIHQPTRTLVAGTYGRSVYKINLDQLVDVKTVQNVSFDFSVFPNPVHESVASISFSLLQPTFITVFLYDVSGKIIWQQERQGIKGKNNLTLDFKNISDGLYMLSMKGTNAFATAKIVKN